IRIDPLADAPRGLAPFEKRPHKPRREAEEIDRSARQNDKPRDERGPKPDGKSYREGGARFDKEAGPKKKKPHRDQSGYAGQSQPASASPAKPAFGKPVFKKPAFGKKPAKNRRG
ncbi:MAG: ATP-dependent helicase DeaD, partial [Gammaproteobacteria bacterium]|nr:ATP-dependent helicase DeaD [Gammaproteobacteria bacterium]